MSKTNLVGYIRVADDTIPQEEQQGAIEHHCRINGITLVNLFNESAPALGLSHMRPTLHRLIEQIRLDKSDGLIIQSLRVISADLRQLTGVFGELENRRIICIQEALDTDTSHGYFAASIIAGLNPLSREVSAAKIRVSMDDRARLGMPRGRWVAFGYQLEKMPGVYNIPCGCRSKLEEAPDEQRFLREILRLHADGIGAVLIARQINTKLGPSPRTKQPWTSSNVAGIIRSNLRRNAVVDGPKQIGEE